MISVQNKFYGLARNVSIARVSRHLHKEDCSMQLKMECSCNIEFVFYCSGLRLKCDGTRAETRFRLSAKRTSPFKWAGASVQSTTASRGVRISCSNAGYTVFRGSVKSTGHPLHSPVSPSLSLPCVTVCHHISTGLYAIRETTPFR